MKYGIALFPSKKLQDSLNAYRKRYDPHYALIPPHITLKEAFEIDDQDRADTIAQKIHEVAATIEPIKISVDRFSSFHPVNNVIYLKVKPDPNLTELHQRLNKDELGNSHRYNFVPHITIAQGLSDIEHSDVLDQLKMIDFNHEETADRFQLLYQLDNGSWTVYETFHLGKGRS